ncbi:MAG: hypothetical protein J4415_00970 [Candidatus Diapherotrites archaeon]|uniref:Uncharacterized protein n=1 Tax=Candidatus Iainarchaeum sp. TaxID=3101447 RepID=A0A8T4KWB5_9ARCH|nr:hypothetical protein [Candidatus Diapherotrites archaeon]
MKGFLNNLRKNLRNLPVKIWTRCRYGKKGRTLVKGLFPKGGISVYTIEEFSDISGRNKYVFGVDGNEWRRLHPDSRAEAEKYAKEHNTIIKIRYELI